MVESLASLLPIISGKINYVVPSLALAFDVALIVLMKHDGHTSPMRNVGYESD